MASKTEAMTKRWAAVDVATRSKIMSDRKRKGDKNRTPEERKAHALIALTKRWAKAGENSDSVSEG